MTDAHRVWSTSSSTSSANRAAVGVVPGAARTNLAIAEVKGVDTVDGRWRFSPGGFR